MFDDWTDASETRTRYRNATPSEDAVIEAEMKEFRALTSEKKTALDRLRRRHDRARKVVVASLGAIGFALLLAWSAGPRDGFSHTPSTCDGIEQSDPLQSGSVNRDDCRATGPERWIDARPAEPWRDEAVALFGLSGLVVGVIAGGVRVDASSKIENYPKVPDRPWKEMGFDPFTGSKAI